MDSTKARFVLVLGCVCMLGSIYIFWTCCKDNLIQKERAKEKITQIENSPTVEDEGYLEISSIALYQVLERGSTSQLLSESKVAYWGVPDSQNIHLVGHRIPTVFAPLEKLKKGDIVELYWSGVYRKYRVSSFHVVSETEFPSFPSTGNLVLITCMEDDSERLIIFCEKVG